MAERICVRLSEGESLLGICTDPDMPGKSTVFQWLHRHPEFADKYARAREVQAEMMAEEILAVADDDSGDSYEDEFGARRTDTGAVQRARLRVDSRKWLASKLLPKKFGDRLVAEHSGPGGKPIELEHKADESFAAVIAALESVGRSKAGDTSGKGEVAEPGETASAPAAE